jgi:hypothetical protein
VLTSFHRTSDPAATARHFTLSFVPSRMEISRESLQDCIAEIQDMFPDNKIHARLHKFTGTLMHATAKKPKPVELAVAFFKSSVTFLIVYFFMFTYSIHRTARPATSPSSAAGSSLST